MGITLDHSDTIHDGINERWDQPPKAEVDENFKVEVDQGQPSQVEQSAKLVISKWGLYIHLH